MRAIGLIAALMIGAVCLGAEGDDSPKTPAARAVLAKLANAEDAATKAYDKAMKEAAENAVKELEQVRANVMKSGGANALEEANRIQSAIEALKASTPSTQTFQVAAGSKPTAIRNVSKGQKITIKAHGKWCADTSKRSEWTMGPELVKRGGNTWGLYAKIGDGEAFPVGDSWSGDAESAGAFTLFLSGGPSTKPDNDDGGVSAIVTFN